MGGLYWVTPEQKERLPWARMLGESQHAEERSAKNLGERYAAWCRERKLVITIIPCL